MKKHSVFTGTHRVPVSLWVCRSIANQEKLAIMRSLAKGSSDVAVSDAYVLLFAKILFDDSIVPSSRALILSESESLSGNHPGLLYRYQDLFLTRTALYQVPVSDMP